MRLYLHGVQGAAGDNKSHLARDFGISRETLYRYLRTAPYAMPIRLVLTTAQLEALLT